ncbi:MAG: phosphoribosylanthranilate isomerase [Salinivirgaceae bacterium]
MKNKLKIKVCGLREPKNIKDVDQLNPDYLGFIFYPSSPRYINISGDKIPETQAKRVGVFVNETIETILAKATEFNLTAIQLHGYEKPEECLKLLNLGFEVFKAFRIDECTQRFEIEPYKNVCTAYLFDTKTSIAGGSGVKFNWKKLDEIAPLGNFILSGGIGPDDAELILNLNYPTLIGVDLNSRFETEPGLKDIAAVARFMNDLQKGKINI